MTIRVFFRALYGVFAFLLAAFAAIAILLYINQKELDRRLTNRFECTELASWLHMSSDELTRLVRTYVVTGQPIFEEYYWRLLDIRNGKKPWPDDRHGEYWDLLVAGKEKIATTGPVISLHERMVKAGLTDEEMALLRKAQEESDTLVRAENIAMHAVKGEFEDGAGGFTRKGPPDQAFASRILFDDAYHDAKARIMDPIRNFFLLVDDRTHKSVNFCYNRSIFYLRTMLGILVGAAALGAGSLLLVRSRILQPLADIQRQTGEVASDMERLARVAAEIARGDLSRSFQAEAAKLDLAGSSEIGMLGRLHDAMRDQLQAAGVSIAAVTAELARRDISMREAQEALVAANKELEAFSYSVSHDLRAPLRHISGFVQILQSHTKDKLDDTAARHLDIIAAAAVKMGALIDDLLSFSRAGRAQMRLEKISLGALVDECRRELEQEQSGRVVEWEVGDLPEVMADRALLRQVLANLLGNAVKYTRRQPAAHIEVSAWREASEVVVRVRDNGAGFDMKYAGKLFGVFQRLHTEAEFEGTGIGLANVHRIVSRHGGRTWAEGEVDHGAAFYFSLPLAPTVAVAGGESNA